jgi:hypothetical protein
MKMTVFWDAASRSTVEIDDVSEMQITLILEAVSTSETSINLYQTKRRSVSEFMFVFAAVRT